MASDDTFEVKFATAKEAISQLLDALDIGTVICVDDIYEAPVTLDDLLIAQSQLSEGELRELFGRPNDVFPDDPAVRR